MSETPAENTASTDVVTTAAPLKRVPLPNVGDLVFVGICQLLLFMRPNFIFTDGSTGWHLVTGMTILASGAIPHSDIMSYTFPGKEWVAYEWLSDVIMAVLVKIGGLDLLALAVTAAIASLILAIYQRMRASDCHFFTALTLCIFGLLASANHWLVRPHIFTFWGVYIFVTRLEDYYQDKLSFKRLCLWLLPYMVLWVNCHPAFLLGFAITAVYLASTTFKILIAEDDGQRRQFMQRSALLCGLLVALLVVSFINPYGVQLYEYISHYLRGTSILAHTDEFKSPNFHFNIHAVCLEILFFALALGFVRNGKKVTLPSFLLTMMFGHLSLWAVRNIPLFAFVTMPLLGRLFGSKGADVQASNDAISAKTPLLSGEQASTITAASLSERRSPSILSNMFGKIARPMNEFNAQEKLSDMHFLPIFYVLVLACIAVFGGRDQANALMHSGFDPESQPIKTLAYIKDNKLEAKEGLSLDNWGGIIRYQLDMPVFIDDRADFYGEKFYNEYGTICEIRPGYLNLLDDHKINWILFPKDSQLIQALKARRDWKQVSEDQASAVLVRVKP
ncbi:MAG: hypothetical protein KGS72_03435 [Cyanobacteria bacterium REEB67]|nr:hypothetical protein [Cyanobacteria bacterium REEB67]